MPGSYSTNFRSEKLIRGRQATGSPVPTDLLRLKIQKYEPYEHSDGTFGLKHVYEDLTLWFWTSESNLPYFPAKHQKQFINPPQMATKQFNHGN